MASHAAAENVSTNPAIPSRNKGGRPKGSATRPMDKLELERVLARQIRSKKIPPQYKSAMASNLASIKGWTKAASDDAGKVDIVSVLKEWTHERVYGTESAQTLAMKARAIGSDASLGSVGVAGDQATGGIPHERAVEGDLSPSPTTTTQKSDSPVSLVALGVAGSVQDADTGAQASAESAPPEARNVFAARNAKLGVPAGGFFRRS